MCSQIYSTKHVPSQNASWSCRLTNGFDRQNPGPTGIALPTAVDHCFTKLTFTHCQCYWSTCLQFEVCLIIGLLKKKFKPSSYYHQQTLHHKIRQSICTSFGENWSSIGYGWEGYICNGGGIWWHTFCGLLCFEEISAKKKGGNQLTYLSFWLLKHVRNFDLT